MNPRWLMKKTHRGFWIHSRVAQKARVELTLQYLPFHMWESTFSAHLDLRIEGRKVDTEAVGTPRKWGKRMENPKWLMIICIYRQWARLSVKKVLLSLDALTCTTMSYSLQSQILKSNNWLNRTDVSFECECLMIVLVRILWATK